MANFNEKKEFALSQLAPYLADPKTCAFGEAEVQEDASCFYLTEDGRMCVAGKNMINPPKELLKSIGEILVANGCKQKGIFKPEVVDILTNGEWTDMQRIHDKIALNGTDYQIQKRCDDLGLFTFEELKERANLLKKDLDN